MLRVALISSGTTVGQRLSDDRLLRALRCGGMDVHLVRPAFRHKGRPWLGYCCANDLYEALALRREIDRAGIPKGEVIFLYATTTATFFEPRRRLERGMLRFDALARENRTCLCCLPVRLLERRSLKALPALLPMSRVQWPHRAALEAQIVGQCPPPVPRVQSRRDAGTTGAKVLCYARPPDKKGLAVLLSAWRLATPPVGSELIVTGIEREEASAAMKSRVLPENVRFVGLLSPDQMGGMLNECQIYLSASRFEDFGSSQMEALSAGLLLVSTLSPGAYDAGALAEQLDPRLVVPAADEGQGLAAALDLALRFGDGERDAYRERAARLVEHYSEPSFAATVAEVLIPALERMARSGRRKGHRSLSARRLAALRAAAKLQLMNLLGRRTVTGDGDAVVCLTSYGRRTRTAHLAVESIARGRVRPKRLVLWLDHETNPRGASRALRRLERRGLEILDCENLGPHKKWFPYVGGRRSETLPLVTADDDTMYPASWLEHLLNAAAHHSGDIVGYRIREMSFSEPGWPSPYSTWPLSRDGNARRVNFVTGVSGVLYPPSFLEHLAASGRDFAKTAPHADDIWLTSVAIRCGVAIRQVRPESEEFPQIPGTWSSALTLDNVGEGSNDRQMLATFTQDELRGLSGN